MTPLTIFWDSRMFQRRISAKSENWCREFTKIGRSFLFPTTFSTRRSYHRTHKRRKLLVRVFTFQVYFSVSSSGLSSELRQSFGQFPIKQEWWNDVEIAIPTVYALSWIAGWPLCRNHDSTYIQRGVSETHVCYWHSLKDAAKTGITSFSRMYFSNWCISNMQSSMLLPTQVASCCKFSCSRLANNS